MGTQETAHWCHECSEITDVLLPTTSWKHLYGIDVGKERPYVNDPMFPNVFNVFPSLSLSVSYVKGLVTQAFCEIRGST
jgi:hypothetical protein